MPIPEAPAAVTPCGAHVNVAPAGDPLLDQSSVQQSTANATGSARVDPVASERRKETAAIIDRLSTTLMEAQRAVHTKYQQDKSESGCSEPVLAQLEGSRRCVVATVRELQEALRRDLPVLKQGADSGCSAVYICMLSSSPQPLLAHRWQSTCTATDRCLAGPLQSPPEQEDAVLAQPIKYPPQDLPQQHDLSLTRPITHRFEHPPRVSSEVGLAVHAYAGAAFPCNADLLSGGTSSRPSACNVLQDNVLFDASGHAQPHAQSVAAPGDACMPHKGHPSAAVKLGADMLHESKAQQAAAADAQLDSGTLAIPACWQEQTAASTQSCSLTTPPTDSHAQMHSGITSTQRNLQDTGMQTEERLPIPRTANVAVSINSTEAALQDLLVDHSTAQITASSANSTAGTDALQDLMSSTLSLAASIEQVDAGALESRRESSDHTFTLMQAMLELDKLTQELKKRCSAMSARSSSHDAEAWGDTDEKEVEAATGQVPETLRFREELANKLSVALPAPYLQAPDKQIQSARLSSHDEEAWGDTDEEEVEAAKGRVLDTLRFREELANKLSAALPAPYLQAPDKQIQAKVCKQGDPIMLSAP